MKLVLKSTNSLSAFLLIPAEISFEENATHGAPALSDVHGPAAVLPGASVHQVSDHLFAKGERLAVVVQGRATKALKSGSVIMNSEVELTHRAQRLVHR